MVIYFDSCPILLLASCFELWLRKLEVILDALTARVGCYLGSTLLPVRLGLLEADLVDLVFAVIGPCLLHCPERVQLEGSHVCL